MESSEAIVGFVFCFTYSVGGDEKGGWSQGGVGFFLAYIKSCFYSRVIYGVRCVQIPAGPACSHSVGDGVVSLFLIIG